MHQGIVLLKYKELVRQKRLLSYAKEFCRNVFFCIAARVYSRLKLPVKCLSTTCQHEVDRLCSAQSAMCSPSSEPTYTAATYETTAVLCLQADHASRNRAMDGYRRGLSSLRSGRIFCARIRRRRCLRSLLMAPGRCRDHTW